MSLEFLSSIEAKTALETPQTLLTWEFEDTVSPISGVEYPWSAMYVRRSLYRFPESFTEGTSILTEAYSSTPTTGISDITVGSMATYYYSIIFRYKSHSSSRIGISQDISRLGNISSVAYDNFQNILSATDGVSNSTAVFTSASSTFLTSGVTAGCILFIYEGAADDGYYLIQSVDSENQITLSASLTLAVNNIDFTIISDHYKYIIGGYDYLYKSTLWRYDTKTQLVDFKVDLSTIIYGPEKLVSAFYVNTVLAADSICIITNLRYLRITYKSGTILDSDIIDQWNLSSSGLLPGYSVVGATYISGFVYLLDSANKSISKLAEPTGVLDSTYDISGLEGTDELHSIFYDAANAKLNIGTNNYFYAFDLADLNPVDSDIDMTTYARQLLSCDSDYYYDYINASPYIILINSEDSLIESYVPEIGLGYLWQQSFVSDKYTVALFHLDETSGNPVDSSSNAVAAVNNNMAPNVTGRFETGYEATSVTDNIDITAISAVIDTDEGSLSIWFKSDTVSQLTSGNHSILSLVASPNDMILIGIVAGNLELDYLAGGAHFVFSLPHPSPDTKFHNYKLMWSQSTDTVKAYLDGVSLGADIHGLNPFAGPIISALLGDTASAALGVYDEFRVTKTIFRTIHAPVYLDTLPNKMWAFSGRDYTLSYDSNDPLGFHYRDHVYTPKYLGGEYFIRNDYERSQLNPPNKVIENGEIVFRGPTPLPTMGDLGRYCRLLGLFLDRIADDRINHISLFSLYNISVEDIEHLCYYLGIPALDLNWNVDKQKRYLRVMSKLLRKAGVDNSYYNLARLLGFEAVLYTLSARRRLDSVPESVVDPTVTPVPFDYMGSLDTSSEYFPLALLRFRFYKRSVKSLTGSTSIPANRLLTDLSATFSTTCKIGNMIKVYDPTTTSDNGIYYVTEIHSDTELKVDKNWPVGSLVGLTYSNLWEVPEPDPYVDYLLNRYKDISPGSMKVMHIDSSL